MSDRTYHPTLAEQPAMFDSMTFRNQEVERVVRSDFEHRLTAAVRATEGLVVDQAGTLKAEIDGLRDAADALRKELLAMQSALQSDEDIDTQRWSVVDGNAMRIAGDAQIYAPRVEAIEERLGDPMAYASNLQARFPSLHRPNLVEQVASEHSA